jgi:hypothetical protein
MNFKVIPGNFVMSEGVPFGQRYVYGSTHPMQRMLEPGYFVSERHRLRAGDTVRVCQMRDNAVCEPGNRVLCFVELVVVESDKTSVEFHQNGEVFYLPLENGELPAQSNPEYAEDGSKAKWRGPKAHWGVVDKDDNVILAGIEDKAIAEQIAAGEVPLPPEVPA